MGCVEWSEEPSSLGVKLPALSMLSGSKGSVVGAHGRGVLCMFVVCDDIHMGGGDLICFC